MMYRTICLPRNPDVDNANVTYTNGELCVRVPKLVEVPEATKKLQHWKFSKPERSGPI
jgi:HSP20 family molecular chaperone IbpA